MQCEEVIRVIVIGHYLDAYLSKSNFRPRRTRCFSYTATDTRRRRRSTEISSQLPTCIRAFHSAAPYARRRRRITRGRLLSREGVGTAPPASSSLHALSRSISRGPVDARITQCVFAAGTTISRSTIRRAAVVRKSGLYL